MESNTFVQNQYLVCLPGILYKQDFHRLQVTLEPKYMGYLLGKDKVHSHWLCHSKRFHKNPEHIFHNCDHRCYHYTRICLQ